ncbi:MAG: Peptidoglycan glycosyltransferase MrdB [Firmicutes bacterium]|nr:Peptidoglycan glycosyltransferase MrdB [candidate division NPL-UPA2 bacterium]
MVDRRLLRTVDWSLYLAYLGLSLFGVLMIASASQNNELGNPAFFWTKQLQWVIIGHVVLLFALLLDYRFFANMSIPIYLLNLSLLLGVLTVGVQGGGAQRWLDLGFFTLQPSEFAKIAVIVTLAAHVEKLRRVDTFYRLAPVLLHVAIPMLLIIMQPDLGTGLVFLGVMAAVLYAAELPRRLIVFLGAGALAVAPVVWSFGLKAYQRARLIVFLDPSLDRMGIGYHLTQSIIAVGSGMFAGRGLFDGPQSELNFLPEQHTDFIFSVIGEELGFLGAAGVIMVMFFVVYRCLQIAAIAKDDCGRYIAVGVASWIAFQLIVNTGMTMGMMPVVGLPLPFLSYGGSSYLALSLGIGFVLNVGMRHRKILF